MTTVPSSKRQVLLSRYKVVGFPRYLMVNVAGGNTYNSTVILIAYSILDSAG